MMGEDMSQDLPKDYQVCERQQGFSEVIGPFYERVTETERVRGFRVESRHCNPEGFLHGGMQASFIDFVMYQGAGDELGTDSVTPSITMTTNFIAAAKQGAWLEGRVKLNKQTRSILFLEAEIFAAGDLIAQASGIYKIMTKVRD